MSNIMSGKELSIQIEEEIKGFAKGCIIRPSVAVINIGNDPISEKFIKAKEDACNRVGIYFRYHQFEEDTPELTIINKIKELNNDDYVNGIMINLPIPEKYNEKRLLNTVINSKDIDGLTDINIGRLISGRKSITPCTVLGIMELLKNYDVELEGKDVVIVGKGKLVGRPLINVLLNEGATVTVCHSRTEDLKKHTTNADIVISAIGIKNIITADMIKEGAVVIDAGCSIEDDKLCGDVDFTKVSKKASLITPSTGGVGPMTVAMFLKNIILCYNNKK
ncbi:MAG: bifunctional 5,10-methylenetetrahydrofolate dehydrogenase/5,10-methenyltetrahydrofolate cyclohydrolase [Bacilli bacterium]|nr:bifunctional 5,10-methylenetetrahydrofolate dehydrogenase/5,10-methenyltetrahydrofolate cyclohydrolase [Bacilli bacterium]